MIVFLVSIFNTKYLFIFVLFT